MKINRNLKINPKYKMITFLSLLLATGCARYEHKNIVTGVGTYNDDRIILLEDVETGEERIFSLETPRWSSYADYYSDYDYLELDDTVTVVVGGMLSDRYYSHAKVLSPENTNGDVGLRFNQDTINARKARAAFNQECKKFGALKQEIQTSAHK